jgi:uncharacterized protein DUF4386
MDNGRPWFTPLTGVLFLLILIVGLFVLGEEPPGVDEDVNEIVDFYVDKDTEVYAGVILEGLAALVLVFFAGSLRRVLRIAEGEGGTLSLVAFAGLLMVATGFAIDATISLTLVETVEDVEPATVQTLAALFENDFVPFAVGSGIFVLALGISTLRHGAFPKWLGWVAIVLAVIAVTPAGFVTALGAALLVGITSVMMALQARSPQTPPVA